MSDLVVEPYSTQIAVTADELEKAEAARPTLLEVMRKDREDALRLWASQGADRKSPK